jgi:hypothetical protein
MNVPANLIAWHYTIGLKLPLIRESGSLRPSTAGIGPDERPVLWFSTAPYWEPTAAKMIARSMKERLESEDGLPFRRLSMQENTEMGEGLYRFGLSASALIRWPEIGKRAGMRAEMRKNLMKTGRQQGADPAQWHGAFSQIPIDGLLLQQLVDFRYWATKERLLHRDNQLAEIAKLEIYMPPVALADLRQMAGDDETFCVNYVRHRLTSYHKLLQRYDAGDPAILSAIRGQIYKSISAVYPELTSECDRQLAERL